MSGRLRRSEDWERLATEAAYKPAKLASLHGTTGRQLHRVFVLQHGTSPRRWLRLFQWRKAKVLLLEGYAVEEVARLLAFADATHFCHAFKKDHGITPGTFARPPKNNGCE